MYEGNQRSCNVPSFGVKVNLWNAFSLFRAVLWCLAQQAGLVTLSRTG
jgi:hypothetical protein